MNGNLKGFCAYIDSDTKSIDRNLILEKRNRRYDKFQLYKEVVEEDREENDDKEKNDILHKYNIIFNSLGKLITDF